MERRLTWYVVIWAAFALGLNVAAIATIVSLAPVPDEGVANVVAAFTPPNVLAWGLEAVLIAPLVVALRWRARVRAQVIESPYASD